MRERLLVTGAAGFIASHLVSALIRRGHHVIGIDNFDPYYERAVKETNLNQIRSDQFEHVEADIRDQPMMRALFRRHRPGGVFHFAALAGVRASLAHPARFANVNIAGLVNLLEAARETGCSHVVFASSSSVYGNKRKVPFSEDDPADEPISPYGATKRIGELICEQYAQVYGLRVAALRLFTVFGPRQRPDLAIGKFMRLIAAGEEVPMYGDGSTRRDYTYIDDVIAGVLASYDVIRDHPVARGSAGGLFRIWNLGHSHPVKLSEMIDAAARVVGKPARTKSLPIQPGDVERTWADLTRSQAELGYQPQTGFLNGMERQWEWMLTSRQALPTIDTRHAEGE